MSDEKVKEELLKSANEVVQFVQAGLQQGADFASEQAPLVVQEILRYGLVTNWLYLLFWVSVIVCTLRNVKTWIRHVENSCDFELEYVYISAGIVLSLIGAISITCLLPQALLVTFAPRLYLLEYIKALF